MGQQRSDERARGDAARAMRVEQSLQSRAADAFRSEGASIAVEADGEAWLLVLSNGEGREDQKQFPRTMSHLARLCVY